MATLTTDGTSQVKHRTTALERVLLVEDDIRLQNTTHEALISEGYKVKIVSSGPIGLALVWRETLSALIIYSQFPASQGHALCREFMQAVLANLSVLLRATPSIGDNAFFLKTERDDPPFIVKELVVRLRGARPGCQSLSESLYVFGDIIVDFVRKDVVRARVQIALTITEVRRLEFLIRKARRAISRDDLLLSLGIQQLSVRSQLQTIILGLRQKVDADPPNPAHLVVIMVPATSSCRRPRLRT
jgi:DNA-binding response OmpR family regulator